MADYSAILTARPEHLRRWRWFLAVLSLLSVLPVALMVKAAATGAGPLGQGDWRHGLPPLLWLAPVLLIVWYLRRKFRLTRWLRDHAVVLEEAGLVIAGRHGEQRTIRWDEITGVIGDSVGLAIVTRRERLELLPHYVDPDALGGEFFVQALQRRFAQEGLGGRMRLQDVGTDLLTVAVQAAMLFALAPYPARALLPPISAMAEASERVYWLQTLTGLTVFAAMGAGVVSAVKFSRIWEPLRLWRGLLAPAYVALLTVLWSVWLLWEWGLAEALRCGLLAAACGAAISYAYLRKRAAEEPPEEVARRVGEAPLPEGVRIRPIGAWSRIWPLVVAVYLAAGLDYGLISLWGDAHGHRSLGLSASPVFLGLFAVLTLFGAQGVVRMVPSASWRTACRVTAQGLDLWDWRGRPLTIPWREMWLVEVLPGPALVIHWDDESGARSVHFLTGTWKEGLLIRLTRELRERAGLTEEEPVQGDFLFRGSYPGPLARYRKPGYPTRGDEWVAEG